MENFARVCWILISWKQVIVHDVQRMGDAECGGWGLSGIFVLWGKHERHERDGVSLRVRLGR